MNNYTYTEPGEPKLEHHYSDEWSSDWNTHYHVCTDPQFELDGRSGEVKLDAFTGITDRNLKSLAVLAAEG